MEVMLAELEQMISTSPSGSRVFDNAASAGNDVLSKQRNYDYDEDDIIPGIW